MGVLLPNITSVAAVGIIFTLLFARDFGLVNWLLGHVGVDPITWQEHRWSSWLAISTMVDWRWTGYNALIFLAALQAVPQVLYEAAAIDGASRLRQFWRSPCRCCGRRSSSSRSSRPSAASSCSPSRCIFNSGANAITGGHDPAVPDAGDVPVEKAFTRQKFGYAATIAWVMFLLIAVVGALNVLVLRRIRSAD